MPSSDSKQQGLRNHKKQFNAKYKAFSQKLKAFKDGVNGKPSKIGIPASSIKDPLPPEVGSVLNALSGEFQALIADVESIIAEQSGYSSKRRKKQPRKPKSLPTNPTQQSQEQPAPDKIVQDLARLGEQEIELEVLASSRVSRLWEYFKGMFSRDSINKQRISLLRMSAELFWKLRDLQDAILDTNIKSTPQLMRSLQTTRYQFSALEDSVERIIQVMETKNPNKEEDGKKDQENVDKAKAKPKEPTEKELENQVKPSNQTSQPVAQKAKQNVPASTATLIANIHDEVGKIFRTGLCRDDVLHLNKLLENYRQAPPAEKHALKAVIVDAHKELIEKMKIEAKKKYGLVLENNALDDLVKIIHQHTSKEANIDTELVKTSGNVITRYMKKQLAKMRPFDETISMRLDAIETLEDLEASVKDIMDDLEKELDVAKLQSNIDTMNAKMNNLMQALSVIITLYQQSVYSNPEESAKLRGRKDSLTHDPMMDFLLRRKIRKDLARGML
jgi:hypothetical protein